MFTTYETRNGGGGKIGEVVAKALHDAKHDASVRRVVLITEQLTPSPRQCQ